MKAAKYVEHVTVLNSNLYQLLKEINPHYDMDLTRSAARPKTLAI